MPEEKYIIQTNEIDCECDICGRGWYRPTGEVDPLYPYKFLHRCTVCGTEIMVEGHTYPYTVTERTIK